MVDALEGKGAPAYLSAFNRATVTSERAEAAEQRATDWEQKYSEQFAYSKEREAEVLALEQRVKELDAMVNHCDESTLPLLATLQQRVKELETNALDVYSVLQQRINDAVDRLEGWDDLEGIGDMCKEVITTLKGETE